MSLTRFLVGGSEQTRWSATAQLLGCAVIVLMGCGRTRSSKEPIDAQDAIRTGAEGALDAWVVADAPGRIDAPVSTADGPGAVDDGRSAADGPGNTQATVLASGQPGPWAIAIDSTNVYWFNLGTNNSVGKTFGGYSDGQVLKCAKSGCQGMPTVLASGREQGGPATPLAFATDGINVYWSDAGTSPLSDPARQLGGLLKCSVNGCDDSPLAIGPGGAWGLAVTGTNVYWTDFEAEIFTCPIAGCGTAPKALWSAGTSPVTLAIAVDAASVYWSTEATEGIMKCAVGGCNNTPTIVMSASVPEMTQIALDTDNIYFVEYNPLGLGQVLACAKTGCTDHPRALATGLNSPAAIATDGVSVYWTEIGSSDPSANTVPWPGAGVVRKCSVNGCNNTPTTLVSGLNAPVAIAVDDGYVYWAEGGAEASDGRIASLPK